MEYQEFVEAAQSAPFVRDPHTADAAVKAIVGILESQFDEQQARELSERLPEPLRFDELKNHQAGVSRISTDEYISEVAGQFQLNEDEALELITLVVHTAKEAGIGEKADELAAQLPPDWSALLRAA